MNNIKLYFSVFILLFLASCSDSFLDQPPRAALTLGSFPNTSDDAIYATNAVYNNLRTWQINTGGFPLLDMMADDAVKGSNPGDGTDIAVFEKFEHTPTEGSIENWYKTLYQSVRRANLVIIEVPNVDMDPTLQNRLIGEARFLRAYFYCELIKGFGAVPKVMEIDPPLDLGRTDVDEILTDIVYPDLEFAMSILPEKSQYAPEDLGRATKGAATALLARIKLFYGDFQAVEMLTREIIQSDEYELVNDFAQIFPENEEHNIESIFEISALPDGFADGGNQYGNTQGVRGSPNKGWGFCRPAYSLIEEYTENADPRMEPSILFLNEVIDGITILGEGATPDTIYSNNSIVEIECYNQKVWVPGTDTETSFGHNRRIIRYADVILMHAEALNEIGEANDALTFLNSIRSRARGANPDVLPDITTTDKSQLRDAIIQERKYEFALEGLRFWDLVRTDKAESVLGPLGFIKGKNELFPIPQSEIDVSQGRISQNPNY
jgi:starch-binding outer membrane protein, SusD/RagB family